MEFTLVPFIVPNPINDASDSPIAFEPEPVARVKA